MRHNNFHSHHTTHHHVHVPTQAELYNAQSVAPIGIKHFERSGKKEYCPDGLWASIINLNVIKTKVFGLVMNPGSETAGIVAGIAGLPPALANMMGQLQEQMQMQGGLTPSPMGSFDMVPIVPAAVTVSVTERYHANLAPRYIVKKGSGELNSDYVNESELIRFNGTFSGTPRYDEASLMQLLKKERAMSEATFRALPKPWGSSGVEPTPEQVFQWLKDVVHPVYHEQIMWDAAYWGTAYTRLNTEVDKEMDGLTTTACLLGCCIFMSCVMCVLSPMWDAEPDKYVPARCKLAALEKAFFDKQEARFDAKYMGVLVEGRPISNGLSSADTAAQVNSQILEEVTRAEDSYVPAASAAAATMER